MKYLLILFLFPAIAFSQKDTVKSNTFLGQANLKIGTIIKKEYSDVYKFSSRKLFTLGTGNITIQGLTITDAATGMKYKGLYVATSSTSDSYSAYIDANEIDGLLKYLDFTSKLNPSNESNEVEYIFNSKDLFFVVFSSIVKNEKVLNYQITVDKNLRNYSTVYLSGKDFEDIAQKITAIKDLLK